jgi:hypothetical protein
MAEETSQYALEVDYKRGTERPAHVFRAMSELIEAFQQLDVDLAKSIAAEIEAVVVLEEVEVGSVRAWLSTILKSVDDSALKKLDWKGIVGTYLVKAKRRIVRFLDNTPTVVDQQQIAGLERDLLALAEETNVRQIPAYTPVPRRRLLMNLNQISASVMLLEDGDSASLVLGREQISINKSFRVPEESIEELLTAETIQSTSPMILKVKKPDLLGQSMWEFRHQKRTFLAKVLDDGWLEKFQARQVPIRPGDSVRALVETRVHYDQFGEVVATHYSVLEVLEVIPLPAWGQIGLDFEE